MKVQKKQLTTLLNKMAVNNENQIQQINSQSSEIGALKDENAHLKVNTTQLQTSNDTLKDENKQLKTENDMIKDENTQLKVENNALKVPLDTLHHHSTSHRVIPEAKPPKVSQWSGITRALHIHYPNYTTLITQYLSGDFKPNHCLQGCSH